MSILSDGTVAIAKTTIYEVDPIFFAKSDVEKIVLFNTSSTDQTAILYVKVRNGTSKILRQFVLQENEGGEYLEPGEQLLLDAGDIIEAETTTASVVDFTVFGTETKK